MSVVENILIVESVEERTAELHSHLVSLGYGVETAATGQESLDRIKAKIPDLIVLDAILPDISGLEVLRTVKETPETSDIPVIMISSDETEEIAIIALSNGASDFTARPLRIVELIAKIQNNLELLRYKKELKTLNKKLEREKRLLTKYFSNDLVEQILNEEISPNLGGKDQVATILFFDIRGATGIAERIPPEAFADFISTIFSEVMNIIFEEKGSVNKLLGDGILATFGCPVLSNDDPLNGIRCAQKIRDFSKTFGEKYPALNGGSFGFGVGISTGRVFAGNVGSTTRMEYTVMGDPVNIASRLQSMCRDFDAEILIDETTKSFVPAEVSCEEIPSGAIRGRESSIRIFRI